jgi:hypothetical protein
VRVLGGDDLATDPVAGHKREKSIMSEVVSATDGTTVIVLSPCEADDLCRILNDEVMFPYRDRWLHGSPDRVRGLLPLFDALGLDITEEGNEHARPPVAMSDPRA